MKKTLLLIAATVVSFYAGQAVACSQNKTKHYSKKAGVVASYARTAHLQTVPVAKKSTSTAAVVK